MCDAYGTLVYEEFPLLSGRVITGYTSCSEEDLTNVARESGDWLQQGVAEQGCELQLNRCLAECSFL